MAVADFVGRLEATYPDRYGESVLRTRCLSCFAGFIVCAASAVIISRFASPEIPLVGDASLVLVAIAGWNLVISVELWRVRRLLRMIRKQREGRTPVRS